MRRTPTRGRSAGVVALAVAGALLVGSSAEAATYTVKAEVTVTSSSFVDVSPTQRNTRSSGRVTSRPFGKGTFRANGTATINPDGTETQRNEIVWRFEDGSVRFVDNTTKSGGVVTSQNVRITGGTGEFKGASGRVTIGDFVLTGGGTATFEVKGRVSY